MPNLNFFGPFHFNDFNANGIYNPASRNNYTPADANGNATPIPDLNQPGIYIWGNLFDVNEKRALLNQNVIKFRSPLQEDAAFTIFICSVVLYILGVLTVWHLYFVIPSVWLAAYLT